jgi:hypothetical protein
MITADDFSSYYPIYNDGGSSSPPLGSSTMPVGGTVTATPLAPDAPPPPAPTSTYRFGAPTGPALDVPTPSSGFQYVTQPVGGFTEGPTVPLFSTITAAPATTTPTTTTSGGTSLTSGPTSPVSTTGGGDALINRLIDLVAAQYAGVGVPGGGSGFGGLVSGPLEGSQVVDQSAPAPTSHKGIIILVLLVAGIGYWFYRSHKKAKRAA